MLVIRQKLGNMIVLNQTQPYALATTYLTSIPRPATSVATKISLLPFFKLASANSLKKQGFRINNIQVLQSNLWSYTHYDVPLDNLTAIR